MNVRDFTRARVRMIVLCVFALCALTVVPASAVAAGHHDAGAHKAKAKGKGKKKPKKKSTTVIVKCASVTVTCKGTPGATGPQGPAGVNGTNGSAVVLRARGAGSVTAGEEVSGCSSILCFVGGENVPVSPSTWTQGPTEDDQLIGTVTIKLPSEAECAAENTSTKKLESPDAFVVLTVNGIIEGFAIAETGTSGRTVSASFSSALLIELEVEAGGEVGSGFFIGSGSSQAHTIAVKASDNCKATQATVSNVEIDVLASF